LTLFVLLLVEVGVLGEIVGLAELGRAGLDASNGEEDDGMCVSLGWLVVGVVEGPEAGFALE
jgi:hypothetical protein